MHDQAPQPPHGLPDAARRPSLVFEVDGKKHYADGDRADPRVYAALAAGTRELQLSGYEVYRFGTAELVGGEGQDLVSSLFMALFDFHQIARI